MSCKILNIMTLPCHHLCWGFLHDQFSLFLFRAQQNISAGYICIFGSLFSFVFVSVVCLDGWRQIFWVFGLRACHYLHN